MASDTLTMRKGQTGEELWSVALGANDTAAFYGVGESDGKAVVVGVSTVDAKFIVQRRSLQSGEVAEEVGRLPALLATCILASPPPAAAQNTCLAGIASLTPPRRRWLPL